MLVTDLQTMESYKQEMLLVIKGESVMDRAMLTEVIEETRISITEAEERIDTIESELDSESDIHQNIIETQKDIISWAQVYDESPLKAQKMIVNRLVHKIIIERGYKIHIEWNISFDEYLKGAIYDKTKEIRQTS